MGKTIREVMSEGLQTCPPDATIQDAAKKMRDSDVGAVLVTEGGDLRGLVTDRDIAVRAVADGRDPAEVKLEEVATTDVQTLSPDDSADDAVDLIREHDVRRIPVVEDGEPVGIVTIGDLAVARDEKSALADISAAAPNN